MNKTPILPHSFTLLSIGLLLAVLATQSPAAAAPLDDGPVYTARFSDLAVGGYDPVAFFTDGAPAKGNSDFETEHRGATWRFANAANLKAFTQDPNKYSPQYGGYCAWAMASGDKAAGKAPYWKIVDDKLYLNYSGGVQGKWLKDIQDFITKADKHWAQIAK